MRGGVGGGLPAAAVGRAGDVRGEVRGGGERRGGAAAVRRRNGLAAAGVETRGVWRLERGVGFAADRGVAAPALGD